MSESSIGPQTYRAWTRMIKIWADGDNGIVSVMKNGQLHLNQEVAQRFCQRWIDAIQLRINRMSQDFNHRVQHSRNEGDVVENLLQVRRGYHEILAALDLPVFPEEMHAQLVKMVVDNAKRSQASLEKNAQNSAILLMIIKNNPIYQESDN